MIPGVRLTKLAEEAGKLSYQVLQRYGHTQGDTDHLLMALIELPGGPVPMTLRQLSIDVEAMRSRLDEELRGRPRTTILGGRGVHFVTPHLSQVMKRASQEASSRKDEYVSTEHLLLAIADERDSPVAEILREFGLTRDRLAHCIPRGRQEGHVHSGPEASTLVDILAAYHWFDHPDGPKFVETHRNAHRTSGHWLFLPGAFSSFHKVRNGEELWLIHLGRLLVHVLAPDGAHTVLRLGTNLAAGEWPVVTVPVDHWQAAEMPEGTPYAFGTNVCAPAFSYEEYAMACREDLLREFPDHADLIIRLTRDG